jgi:cell division protein FtsI (penicillin-binding protein 3)
MVLLKTADLTLGAQPRLAGLSRRQFQSKLFIKPQRGTIRDRSGVLLATSQPAQSLACNPNLIANKKGIAKRLAHKLGLPYATIFQKLQEKREFTWIKRKLTSQQFKLLLKDPLFSSPNAEASDAFWFIQETMRNYPQSSAKALVGSVDIDDSGIEGLELEFNAHLRGKQLSQPSTKDAKGRPTLYLAHANQPFENNDILDVEDGLDLTLTLDIQLQKKLHQALESALVQTGASRGLIGVMEAQTGEILALVQECLIPHTCSETRSRAISDSFEPGSIIKPLHLASALESGLLLKDKLWAEKGRFLVQGVAIKEAEAHEKFEWLTLEKMIVVSSNIAAAKLALKLGAKATLSSLQKFGLGQKTQIGFPGEVPGRLPLPSTLSALSLANIGFGHGFTVSALQMLRAYCAFFNGGWLVKPKLLLHTPPESQRILQGETAQAISQTLALATAQGTGKNAKLEGFTVAGKTGTAQMVDPVSKNYSKENYIATFIGSALHTQQTFVILTLLEKPQTHYYASQTAAPLFKTALKITLDHYGYGAPTLAPTLLPSLAERPPAPAPAFPSSLPPSDMRSSGFSRLRGLTSREAYQELFNTHPCLFFEGTGFVTNVTSSKNCLTVVLREPPEVSP